MEKPNAAATSTTRAFVRGHTRATQRKGSCQKPKVKEYYIVARTRDGQPHCYSQLVLAAQIFVMDDSHTYNVHIGHQNIPAPATDFTPKSEILQLLVTVPMVTNRNIVVTQNSAIAACGL